MKISDLLSPTDVMIDVRASNKRLLLQEFASKAAVSLGLPVDQIAPYLLKREELGSTGIGRGVAIPHARLPDLQRPHGLLAKLKQPIEFDAIDGQAVDIVFVLFCRLPWRMHSSARSRCGPDVKTAGKSRAIAERKEYVGTLFGDRLTIGLTAIRRAGIASTAPRTLSGSRS